jgi:hypothetical protein
MSKATMKITGYRTLQTIHDWGRPVGDVNGHIASGITEVPVVIVDTDEGVSGVGMGSAPGLGTALSRRSRARIPER